MILDWVPGHFPKDAHGLARFDGTALYEHADPRQGEHQDWGTLIFNYGRNEVRNFLLSNALFWLRGVSHRRPARGRRRVDAVSRLLAPAQGEWIPNRFGGRENLEAIDVPAAAEHADARRACRARSPSRRNRPRGRRSAGRCYLGGLGFTFKWNMGWMHDMLEYVDARIRSTGAGDHSTCTFSLLYAFTENFILPFSHDEVVHGKGSMLDKMPGDDWQKARDAARALRLHVRAPGQEAAVHGRRVRPVARVEPRSQPRLAPARRAAARRAAALRAGSEPASIAREPALHEVRLRRRPASSGSTATTTRTASSRSSAARATAATSWSRSSTSRRCRATATASACREPGYYAELLNSDAAVYGGSNVGNGGACATEPIAAHGYRAVAAPDAPAARRACC